MPTEGAVKTRVEPAQRQADDDGRTGTDTPTAPLRRRPRDQRSPLAALLRYPALGLSYGIGRPALKLLGGTRPLDKMLRAFGRNAARDLTWPERYRSYAPSSQDVFVCSYFKSGTNWTLQMAYQVATRGAGEYEHIHDVVAWPDTPGLLGKDYAVDLFDESPVRGSPTGLRVVKTHLYWGDIPYANDARYILVVRDPKDVFVSSYFFARDVILGPFMPTVAEWLEFFLTRDFMMGYWPEHAESYWSQRRQKNVLLLTFKEMKADLVATVRRIADFMEVEMAPEHLQRVVEKSHFSYMKNIDFKFHPGAVMPWTSTRGRMMRRGTVGESGELLSAAEQRRIDETFRGDLARLGSDLEYDTLCASPVLQ